MILLFRSVEFNKIMSVDLLVALNFSKGGHPQFKSAPPQLRNIADNQIDCGVAD